MTTDWQDSAEKDQAIARVQGNPKRDDEGKLSRRELLTFDAVRELLSRKLREGGELAEEFIRAKVAQESNAAKKTAAEAAELTSRREENEANADMVRQQAASQFIENIRQISKLGPIEQTLALAKVMEENPDIARQLDRIQTLVDTLRLTRGLRLEQNTDATVATISDGDNLRDTGA